MEVNNVTEARDKLIVSYNIHHLGWLNQCTRLLCETRPINIKVLKLLLNLICPKLDNNPATTTTITQP